MLNTTQNNGVKFVKVGNTDIEISQICIGAMSFGKAGTLHEWTLDEKASAKPSSSTHLIGD